MSVDVTIIDYGVGNLLSVRRALEKCGANVVLANRPEQITQASKILLPGVGAFGEGMRRLSNRGLDDAVRQFALSGGQILGICLGMQMLMDSSEEFGVVRGLGLIPGTVVSLSSQLVDGQRTKIPHIGWSDIVFSATRDSWRSSILSTTSTGTAMYFVHSFVVLPSESGCRLADCVYDGTRIAALIGQGNIWGAQFHPEKSGSAGLSILREFLRQE